MLKMVLTFIIFFVIVHVAIMLWRDLTQKQKWSVLKGLAVSSGIASAVVVFLSLFVAVF